ncbi:MAG: hypothetical protein CW345_08340 [Firmicutes bacterium]|nr:hypothetical protein [Bacillota bacterium]MBO2521796.1 hypothetical protein [Bacillota bacterium]
MALETNVISIVHPMAFPGPGNTKATQRGQAPAAYLLNSIRRIIDDPYFRGIEITQIKDPELRAEVARLLREAGVEVTYSAQPVQLLNEDEFIDPTDISSLDEVNRRRAIDRLKACIDEALEIGAVRIGIISGKDPGAAHRMSAIEALILSLDELCAYAAERSRELGRKPLEISLELFDRRDEPGCKHQLIGPAREAVKVAHAVRKQLGHANFGLMYDLSHMPLLDGEGLQSETPAVLKLLAPYLNHVHIGSCVLDKSSPLYGDTHPSFDHPDSYVGQELLAAFVKELHEIGWKGGIGFEVMPHGDQLPEAVIESTKAYFNVARSRLDVNYALGTYAFSARRFLPEYLFDRLSRARLSRREAIREAAAARVRREHIAPDGKLLILAADHPARYVTGVGDDPVRMGDRLEYLARIVRILKSPLVDGVMATPDIFDELFLIDYLLKEAGKESLLDGKVMIGSMNRTGLAGLEHEMDDRISSYTPQRLKELRLDGGKMLFRIDPDRNSRYSIATIYSCAKAVEECDELGLDVFLEPLPVQRKESGYEVEMTAEALIKAVGVATALGGSSTRMWIKIPYVDGYHRVARSTTLPILMLGGAATGNPLQLIQSFERGLGEGDNVRGAMVGRNVLFPGDDDPFAVAEAVGLLIHRSASAAEAVQHLAQVRGRDMEWLKESLA